MFSINPENGNLFWNEPYPGDMPTLSWHKEIPSDAVFPLKRAQFYGEWFTVPAKLESYLKLKYGEDLSPSHVWDAKESEWVKKKSHAYFSIQDQ